MLNRGGKGTTSGVSTNGKTEDQQQGTSDSKKETFKRKFEKNPTRERLEKKKKSVCKQLQREVGTRNERVGLEG